MGWDPSPGPPALLFCVATQSWRWGRRWQSPRLGRQAALVPPAVPSTPCSPTQPWLWPAALPRAARAAGVLQHRPCTARALWPRREQLQVVAEEAFSAHCLPWCPKAPLVVQSWALTPRESQQSSTGTGCCVEELKQVVPQAGHKAEASCGCLLQVTPGPSYAWVWQGARMDGGPRSVQFQHQPLMKSHATVC